MLLAILAGLTLYRAAALYLVSPDLFMDEAYYWVWSRSFEFGYFSKPPMVGWLIGLTTAVCGDAEMCVRVGPLLLYPVTAWWLYLVGRRLFGGAAGVAAALLFITMPGVWLGSWFVTTDALLLLFWSAALYFVLRALPDNRLVDWLLTGTCIGLGVLSKYTMLVFPASLLLYLALTPEHRHHLRRAPLYWALGIAVLILLPNLLWNAAHDFISIRHTADIAYLDRQLFHPARLGEFLAGQLLVYGPLAGALFLAAWLGRRHVPRWPGRVLLFFALPLLAGYSVQALLSKANVNWAVASYTAASLFTAAWLLQTARRRWLGAALAVNIVLGLAIYHYPAVLTAAGHPPGAKADIYQRVKGWRMLGEQVRALFARYPGARLLGEDRTTLSQLLYYLRPYPRDAVIWNPTRRISDHYCMTMDVADSPRGEFILVAPYATPEQLAAHFERVEELEPIRIPLYPDYARRYRVYLLVNFLGYPQ